MLICPFVRLADNPFPTLGHPARPEALSAMPLAQPSSLIPSQPFNRTLSHIGVIAQPVAQRHQIVSGSLALLFIGLELSLGSRAAAPIGDKVL